MRLDARDLEASPPAQSEREIVLPAPLGEVIDPDNPDALIDAYELVDRYYESFSKSRKQLALAIAGHVADQETKTRRLRGSRRKAKIEMPDDYWNQGILKEAWNSYPRLRDELMNIQALYVKKRELKKARTTKGPADYEQFVSMVERANQGPSGTPRITVEG